MMIWSRIILFLLSSSFSWSRNWYPENIVFYCELMIWFSYLIRKRVFNSYSKGLKAIVTSGDLLLTPKLSLSTAIFTSFGMGIPNFNFNQEEIESVRVAIYI